MLDKKYVVLIAEDEDDVREIYVKALESMGFEVLQASDGLQALDVLEKKHEQIDVVLLDIVMPKMDGMDVLRKIKGNNLYSDISFIMCTNLDDQADQSEALSLGAKEYFIKSRHIPSELVKEVLKYVS